MMPNEGSIRNWRVTSRHTEVAHSSTDSEYKKYLLMLEEGSAEGWHEHPGGLSALPHKPVCNSVLCLGFFTTKTISFYQIREGKAQTSSLCIGANFLPVSLAELFM